jgi:hypothetical protein
MGAVEVGRSNLVHKSDTAATAQGYYDVLSGTQNCYGGDPPKLANDTCISTGVIRTPCKKAKGGYLHGKLLSSDIRSGTQKCKDKDLTTPHTTTAQLQILRENQPSRSGISTGVIRTPCTKKECDLHRKLLSSDMLSGT